jgi:ferredoxin
MYRIHLAKMGKTFEAEADEIVLEAAERAGIVLAFSCRSGTCRSCMTRVLSGCVEHDPEYADELHIDRDEMDEGYRLLCSGFACSDAELDR